MKPTVVVLAKAPVPGLAKTRLIGRWTAQQAAALAEAALTDTLDTVTSWDCRPLCVLAGAAGPWLPPGTPVAAQVEGELGVRIAGAFEAAFKPGPWGQPSTVLLVGMDTPQLTHAHLEEALRTLETHDAVLGPAADGGWWLLGLHTPAAAAITGVPTSRGDTGARQRAALAAAGLSVGDLPVLIDVDTPADALAVATGAPHTRFARLVSSLAAAA